MTATAALAQLTDKYARYAEHARQQGATEAEIAEALGITA